MSITLEEIVATQHQQLNTLSRKIIYLMIRNQADDEGWSTISGSDFCRASALSKRSVEGVIKHLINSGIVERKKSAPSQASPYKYRIVTL